MEDPYARAFGLAHSAILTELISALLKSQTISKNDALSLLTRAGESLASKGTDVAAAAMEHVRQVGQASGAAPSGADSQAS